MDSHTLRQLLTDLISDDYTMRGNTRHALFALDEDAVTLLVDEFFAGVNEALGLAMLDVETGGGPVTAAELRWVGCVGGGGTIAI